MTAEVHAIQADRPFEPSLQRSRSIICYPFTGVSVGGSHISVLGLLRHLDKGRFDPLVVTEAMHGSISRVFSEFAQDEDPISNGPGAFPPSDWSRPKFRRTFRAALARAKFLARNRVDLVHVNDGGTAAEWAIPAKLNRLPLVWHSRGNPGALGLRFMAPAFADHVLCVSNFAMPNSGIWSARSKAEVLHSPFDTKVVVDAAQARKDIVTELGLSEDTVIVAFVGAFVERKRPLVFVDTVLALREMTDRPVVGVMFGEPRTDGQSRALREHLNLRAAHGSVHLMGHRDPGSRWMSGCDILLVPAVGEPFGRTLIEAMIVNTPVVAARSGGNIEAIAGADGLLAEPDDPQSLAQACLRLITTPGLAERIASRARAKCVEQFGEVGHAERIGQIYDELLRTRKPRKDSL